MLPVLRLAAEKNAELSEKEVRKILIPQLHLTEDELNAYIPSRKRKTIDDRIHWAVVDLKQACLLEPVRQGTFRITARGKALLQEQPESIDRKILKKRYPEFVAFLNRRRKKGSGQGAATADSSETDDGVDEASPAEALENAYERMRDDLADELLEALKQVSPSFFERIVVDLLLRMGYGGFEEGAGHTVGRSGDGGIDGIIHQDKLGLDVIYIQAKRWDNAPVGRPEMQKFAGALQEKHASKGVFITTSRFTDDARDCVTKIGPKIALIDGETLARLMIDYDVGVSTIATYPIKRIDSDYFEEDA